MRWLVRRSLLATVAPMVAPMVARPALAQSVQSSPLGWAGWMRCDVNVQGPGYTDQMTHTWVMGGAPTVDGAFRVYPGTWSVAGGGGLHRTRGTTSLNAQWAANVQPLSAPFAVYVRASDGKMFIQSRHTQLRARGAIQGYQQQTVAGKTQRPAPISLEAFEWLFPALEVPAARTTLSGSMTLPTTGSVGVMQPAGSQGTSKCSWEFGQGAAAPAPPPAVPARAVPVAP